MENGSLSSIQQIGEDAISNGIFVDLYDKDSNLVWGADDLIIKICVIWLWEV